MLIVVLQKQSLLRDQSPSATSLPHLEQQGMMDNPMINNSVLALRRPAPVPIARPD